MWRYIRGMKWSPGDQTNNKSVPQLLGELKLKSSSSVAALLNDTAVKASRTSTQQTSKTQEPETMAVCKMEDSPFRIHKMAAVGNMKQFENLYNADNSRLHLKDNRGMTVLHHAASKSKLHILDFIIAHGGDLNTCDKKGNTALHTAVIQNSIKSISYLLEKGACTFILDQENRSPLHLAVDLNQHESVKELVKFHDLDLNIRGDLGASPLHYAASKDHHECAKILLDNGAKLNLGCALGFFPVHEAAKQGASKTLQVILEHAKIGEDNLADLVEKRDRDKNTPLHFAVNSGNVEAVRICLKYKASICEQTDDGSSPVHLAAAQGSLEMVRTMLEDKADEAIMAVCCTDVGGMTPIHTAALFNHPSVVEYLVQQGGDINARDKEERTPIILASSKHGWQTVILLLKLGADIRLTDQKNRNFLHLAILNGAKLQDFGVDFLKDVKNLFNDKDDFGCTPLHYASQEGHLAAIDGLIRLGAFLNIKNNQKESPLHFAARYGRLNTCYRLLEGVHGQNIINDTEGDGLTALHIAAQNGHVKVVQCLLHRGAVMHRNNTGNTPLHLAAENGYSQTIKMLLSVQPHILNTANKQGNTALHLAAKAGHVGSVMLLLSMGAAFARNQDDCYFIDLAIENRHKDVAMSVVSHERWREVMDLGSDNNTGPMKGLVQHLPEVCLAVLDRCQSTSGHESKSKHFHYVYDFRYLQCPMSLKAEKVKKGENVIPMQALNTMVRFNRVECLSHPVCVNFLTMKWRAYGSWFHMINIFIYVLFLACLTTFVSTFKPTKHTDGSTILNMTSKKYDPVPDPNHTFNFLVHHKVAIYLITGFCALSMLKEVAQMFQQRLKYFTDLTNLLEWVLYITSSVFITPALVGLSTHWQWQCGAIAVFLAWFNLLLYLQRFDFFGIYVVMFLEILKTLLQVIIVFSILIIAFGLSFYILLSSEDTGAHQTPALSLMRTFIMMLGELDYIPTWVEPYNDNNPRTMHFDTLTFLFLLIFILLMPILLMNLLIGLAVGDIESVQRNARLKRLAMQVELHTDLERKLPRKLLEYVDKTEYHVYPNSTGFCCSKMWQSLSGHDDDDDNRRGGASFITDSSLNNSFLMEEFYKQKRRLREMSENMEKQYDLLRLVVQKMEIRSEADEKDVGCNVLDQTHCNGNKSGLKSIGWSSPGQRSKLFNHLNAVSQFKKKIRNGQPPL